MIYTIWTANLSPESSPDGYFTDTVLELYKSDGVTLLDENDDYAGTNASRIEWQAPEDGTYLVKVYNFNPSFYGCDAKYDLLFEKVKQLDITKTAPYLSLPLSAGQRITYTVAITNSSDVIHTNVVVTDALPMGTTYLTGSLQIPSGSFMLDPELLTIKVGDLNPGESRVFEFIVVVDEGYTMIGGNTAGVSSKVRGQDVPVNTAGPIFPYPDADGDGIPDSSECPGGTDCDDIDTDGDGTPDYLDTDSDGDGIPDGEEWGSMYCPGDPNAPDCDTDGDGIPDYQDDDDDGDGIPTADECDDSTNCPDTDGDGLPDYRDGDDDGDGIPTALECPNNDPVCRDSDRDGLPDYLDTDDDNDSIPSQQECPNGPVCPDTDGDGTPDYLDFDSDNDGVPDNAETGDSDGDGIPDFVEPNGQDTDGDGIPDYSGR